VSDRLAEFRWRYLPPGCRVFLFWGGFAAQRSARCGVVLGSSLYHFTAHTWRGRRQEMMNHLRESLMKRKDHSELRSLSRHAGPEDLAASFPNLAEFMTAAQFEGGTERRESPTVTVWAAGGQWKMAVKDRAEGLVLWLSADRLLEVLQLAELYVLEAEAPWRHDQDGHERNGKRVQKKA
jgi:hypothetical protein